MFKDRVPYLSGKDFFAVLFTDGVEGFSPIYSPAEASTPCSPEAPYRVALKMWVVFLVLLVLLSTVAVKNTAAVKNTTAVKNTAVVKSISELRFSPWELVTAVAWSPNGGTIAAGAGDRIYLLSVDQTGETRLDIQVVLLPTAHCLLPTAHCLFVGALTHSLAFSPDGNWLAAASQDGHVRVWDVSAFGLSLGQETPPSLALDILAHKKGANSVAFSPDGSVIASGGNDAVARLWEMPGGRLVNEMIGGTFVVPAIAFDPTGNTLAVVNGNIVRLRDVQSGRISGTLRNDTSFFSLSYSPDGQMLASGDNENNVQLWDPAQAYRSGQEKYPQPLAQGQHNGTAGSFRALVWQVAFSPDGAWLASAGGDGALRLWQRSDAAQPEQSESVQFLWGHPGGATCLAFSPDGSLLISGGLDGVLRLWQLR